jgi:biotin carboxylase
MQFALERFIVSGVDTDIAFHELLLKHYDFRNGEINTRWFEDVVLPNIRSLQ